MWITLLIRDLEEVDGVSQRCLLQSQGEDQSELIRKAIGEHLTERPGNEVRRTNTHTHTHTYKKIE